jgi:hypothetical protein
MIRLVASATWPRPGEAGGVLVTAIGVEVDKVVVEPLQDPVPSKPEREGGEPAVREEREILEPGAEPVPS